MTDVRSPYPVSLSDTTRKLLSAALRSLADDLVCEVPDTAIDPERPSNVEPDRETIRTIIEDFGRGAAMRAGASAAEVDAIAREVFGGGP